MSTAAIVVAAAGDQLDRIGAIAGLASVIGLGVLSLLYFAQAREVKRLRDWAGRSPERAAEMEQRVQTDAQRRVEGAPLAPSTTAAQQQQAAAAALYAKLPPPPPPPAPLVPQVGQLARPGVPVATAVPPAAVIATSKLGSPPTAPVSATPTPIATPIPTATSVPPPVAAPPGSVTPTPTPIAVPAVPPAATVTKAAPAKATAYPTAATTAAAAAAARAAPTPSSLGNGSGDQHTQASAAARPSYSPEPPAGHAHEDGYDDGGFAPGRVMAIIGGGAVAILVAVLLMVGLTGDEPKPPPNEIGPAAGATEADEPSTPAKEPDATSGATSVDRPATNVAVLNGTTQTGLARGVADKLEQAKFTISTVGNNADQRVPQTIVSYTEGNEPAAQIVADTIDVDRSDVQPSDRNTTVSAEADVVVTVGTDQIE